MGEQASSDERRRRWLAAWVRDESFWRDVASRTLSGILAAGVGAVLTSLAAAAGLLWIAFIGLIPSITLPGAGSVAGFVLILVALLVVALTGLLTRFDSSHGEGYAGYGFAILLGVGGLLLAFFSARQL